MDPQDKNQILAGVSSALRDVGIAQGAGTQRVAFIVATLLDETPGGEPVPLDALHQHLSAAKVSAEGMRDFFAILKAREAQWGIQFTLPEAFARLDAMTVLAIAERVEDRARAAHTPDPRGKGTAAAAEAYEVPSHMAAPDHERAATRRRRLQLALAVTLVLGVGFVLSQLVLRRDGPQQVKATDPAGLRCDEALLADKALLCRTSSAWIDAQDKDALKARAAITRAWAQTLGAEKVLLLSTDDGKLRGSY
jgi:hypothetical protein